MKKHVAKVKRGYLREGLSVIYATWPEWQAKYLPDFKRECRHELATKPNAEEARLF